jgi:opacity protein-like surface antigen
MKKLLTVILLSAATSAFAASPYVGASAGYLIDSEDELFSVRIGAAVAQSAGLSHNIEGEVAFSSLSESGINLDLLPVMANYRLTGPVGTQTKLGFYAGAGLGATRVKLSGWGYDDNSWAFAAQAFGGIAYNVSPKAALTVGARYLWIDDVTLGGISAEVGDDVALEVGIRFQF